MAHGRAAPRHARPRALFKHSDVAERTKLSKNTADGLKGPAIFIGVLVVVSILFYGLPRLSSMVYRFANPASGFVFVLDLLSLPFALSRRLRPLVGTAIHISSFLFGIVVRTFCAMFSYAVWGYLGLFVGLVWLGIGVVPVSLIAATIHGDWFLVFMILGNLVMIFGFGALGLWIMRQGGYSSDFRPLKPPLGTPKPAVQ
jgi:hypothetical protein